MANNRIATILAMLGLLLIMAAVALPVLHVARTAVTWTYATGALLLIIGRFMQKTPAGASLMLRRLLRMEIWTALVFVAGAVFLFLPVKPGAGEGNDWIAFTLAGGVLTLYTSIMIPRQKLENTTENDVKSKAKKRPKK